MLTRVAVATDAQALCDVINPLIEAGGTTAHRTPFDPDIMVRHYIQPPRNIACSLVEDSGHVMGFQALEWADPDWSGPAKIPSDWAVIATFVQQGHAQKGLGSRLFSATLAAARVTGVTAIDATILRENTGGLTYYSRMGFVDYRETDTSISKRYDLD